MPALNSLLPDLKYSLMDSMSKGFIPTIFVNSCIVSYFGIVGDVVVETGDARKVLMIPLLHIFFLVGHPLKAKRWEDYLLHIRSADLFGSYF